MVDHLPSDWGSWLGIDQPVAAVLADESDLASIDGATLFTKVAEMQGFDLEDPMERLQASPPPLPLEQPARRTIKLTPTSAAVIKAIVRPRLAGAISTLKS